MCQYNLFLGTCAVMEVISGRVVFNWDIDGYYTYWKKSNDRLVFRHNTEPKLCLFYNRNWRVDTCTTLTHPTTVGLIRAQGANQQNPQDLAWIELNYSTPDATIVVKCK